MRTTSVSVVLVGGIVLVMAAAALQIPPQPAAAAEAQHPSATGPPAPTPPAQPGERLRLLPGAAPIVRKNTVVGSASQTFVFLGRRGHVVSVDLRSTNTSLYFNLRPADSLEAVYASDRGETGNKADVTLPADGEYRIDVYLFRSAARRGVKAPFTLSIGLKP